MCLQVACICLIGPIIHVQSLLDRLVSQEKGHLVKYIFGTFYDWSIKQVLFDIHAQMCTLIDTS